MGFGGLRMAVWFLKWSYWPFIDWGVLYLPLLAASAWEVDVKGHHSFWVEEALTALPTP